MTGHGKCTVDQRNGYVCHQDALYVVGKVQACAQHVAKALQLAERPNNPWIAVRKFAR